MKQPLLHPRTAFLLKLYLKNPAHGLLLTGEDGIGKYYVSKWLAEKLHMNYVTVAKDEKSSSISIEQIRRLYSQTKTGSKQLIIIQDAHQMGIEAQNAFLKLLEEPPANTLFVLTSDNLQPILPTIQSRLVTVPLQKSSSSEFCNYFNTDSIEFKQLLNIADFLPGMVSKAIDDLSFQSSLRNSMELAKKFYASSAYDRFKELSDIKYEKAPVILLLKNLSILISALINSNSEDKPKLSKLTKQAKLISESLGTLNSTNANLKIQLTNVVQVL